MPDLRKRLADYVAKLKTEAHDVNKQQPTDTRSDLKVRSAKAELCERITRDLEAILGAPEDD